MKNGTDLVSIDRIMQTVARGAGKIILQGAGEQIRARTKTSFRDMVTQYDVQVQEYTIGKLKTSFPEAVFISEEKDGFQPKDDSLIFVIDPIDGTANFVHHCQHSCVSIGCIRGGVPVAAVVYDPFMDELFSAVKGQGAFLNGEPLSIPEHSLKESLVYFGSAPYNMELADETFQNIRKIFGKCQDIRRSGSAALDLCCVAAGRAGLFFESILSVWDYAAGALIVQEAGGVCTDMNGQALIFDRPVKRSVIAGSAQTVPESGLVRDGSCADRDPEERPDEKKIRDKYSELTLLLIRKDLVISTMESCTAGQIASLITDTEGSSAIFRGAFVTYSNEAKIQAGVPEEIIQRNGVYSPETASSMAEECRRVYRSDIAVGVTGSFGNPDPNNADSIPGNVYAAIAEQDRTQIFHYTVPAGFSRPDSKLFIAEQIADVLLQMLK